MGIPLAIISCLASALLLQIPSASGPFPVYGRRSSSRSAQACSSFSGERSGHSLRLKTASAPEERSPEISSPGSFPNVCVHASCPAERRASVTDLALIARSMSSRISSFTSLSASKTEVYRTATRAPFAAAGSHAEGIPRRRRAWERISPTRDR